LAKAITLPSLEVGAEIEPALVKEIIDDMKGEPGALPLMSFALRDLFLAEKTTKGEAMDITLQEYLDRGGIDQALERHADKVFASFTDEQKELAKGIFSKLVTVGEGRLDTRRTARFKELKPANADASAVVAVVGKLSAEDVRLVTTSGVEDSQELTVEEMSTAQATVTISHEKLIDAWPWLRRLIDENRELIVLQNQIQTDAWKWGEEKDNGYLYRGGRLSNVEENLRELKPNLDQMSKRFIDASIRQRQLIRWGTITVVALLLIIFAGAAFAFSQQAARAQMQGERALAQSLQANSRALVANQPNNQELAKARLLAVEGLEVNEQVGSLDDKTGSVSLLFSLGYEQPIAYQPVTILRNHSNEVTNVAWNGDGSRLASASTGNTVIIWDTANWEPVTLLSGHTNQVTNVAWNGDSSRLASASWDTTIIIWKFPDFAQLHCQLAGRNLSLTEWEKFLPDVDYHCTCEEWPAGDGAPTDAQGCAEQ
jgi:hypothetical protein